MPNLKSPIIIAVALLGFVGTSTAAAATTASTARTSETVTGTILFAGTVNGAEAVAGYHGTLTLR